MISPAYIDECLLANRNKSTVEFLVNKIAAEGLDLKAYFEYIKTVDSRRKWTFTWLLTHLIESDHTIGNTHQKLIWEHLKATSHDGMKRDLWRSLTFIQISEELSSEIFDAGLKVITSQKEAVAVRAHSMLVLAHIALPYAELRKELILIFDSLKNDDSAGIRSRVKNLTTKLKKVC